MAETGRAPGHRTTSAMPPPSSTLTCRDLVELLDDYLAGELPTDQRGVLEAHLVGCDECRAYLRSYGATVRTVREICRGSDELPPELPDALVQAVVAARRATAGRPRRRR